MSGTGTKARRMNREVIAQRDVLQAALDAAERDRTLAVSAIARLQKEVDRLSAEVEVLRAAGGGMLAA